MKQDRRSQTDTLIAPVLRVILKRFGGIDSVDLYGLPSALADQIIENDFKKDAQPKSSRRTRHPISTKYVNYQEQDKPYSLDFRKKLTMNTLSRLMSFTITL
jgi:hypothetical protein